MMVAPPLLSGLFAALLSFCMAVAVGLTPGSIDVSLVFPLNDTYAPPRGPLPLVFVLSTRPFQPALASTLNLQLNYLLVEAHNVSNTLASGAFDLGTLYSSSVKTDYVFFTYSEQLAGREGQFELLSFVRVIADYTSTNNSSTGDNKQADFIYDTSYLSNTYFTTQSGAQAPDVPSASNGTTCLPCRGCWSMMFLVSDYIEHNSETVAVMESDWPTISARDCAFVVDAATAASITAGVATATAAATTTTASFSSSGAAPSTAGILSGSGTVAAFWSLLMLGLSVVLFIC